MPRPPFPKTLRQFQSDFATEEACERYLALCRWPDGFLCPRCGNRRAYDLVNQRRWQCAGCRHQVSLTAGTVLHRTKVPLTHWFWAAYLMTTDKRGVSALLLQRQLGLSCYETAWMLLHKLRRAMVNVAREPLYGEVEVDETWIGGEQAGLRGSRLSDPPWSRNRSGINRVRADPRSEGSQNTTHLGLLSQADKQKLATQHLGTLSRKVRGLDSDRDIRTRNAPFV